MKKIELNIRKESVYDKVAEQTSYIAVKHTKVEGEDLYDKITATEYDSTLLDRYFSEASSLAVDTCKPFLSTYDTEGGFSATLNLPDNTYNDGLQQSMNDSLLQFFVSYITMMWSGVTNAEGVEGFATETKSMLDDFTHKLYNRIRPKRRV